MTAAASSDEKLRSLLAGMSPGGVLALQLIAKLHIRAGQSIQRLPMGENDSKEIRVAMSRIRLDDLHHVVANVTDTEILPFFRVELDAREGRILNWYFCGIEANHIPDLRVILRGNDHAQPDA